MLASILQPHIWTTNLLVIGLVRGLIISLIAMGIVLVYRSSRVINFAVGDLGVPAAALLAVMAGKSQWPYWPSLFLAVWLTITVATIDATRLQMRPRGWMVNTPRLLVTTAMNSSLKNHTATPALAAVPAPAP